MPQTVTIERHKLNQGMYQKLKKFIMNKRKREAEERAQDDYYKRLKKEREDRKRQSKIYAESLKNTKREIMDTMKKVELLKTERDSLFIRYKQLTAEVTSREKSKRDAIMLLSSIPARAFGTAYQNDSLKTSNNMQIGKSVTLSQFTSDSGNTSNNARYATKGARNKRPLAGLYQTEPVSKCLSGSEGKLQSEKTSSHTTSSDISQQDYSNLSKCLMGYGSSSCKLQPDIDLLNPANVGALKAFLNSSQLASNSLNYSRTDLSNQNSLVTSSATTSSTTSLVHNTSIIPAFLSPAPTSYRGSITTGQSAQQIHMQQLAQAHIFASPNHPSNYSNDAQNLTPDSYTTHPTTGIGR